MNHARPSQNPEHAPTRSRCRPGHTFVAPLVSRWGAGAVYCCALLLDTRLMLDTSQVHFSLNKLHFRPELSMEHMDRGSTAAGLWPLDTSDSSLTSRMRWPKAKVAHGLGTTRHRHLRSDRRPCAKYPQTSAAHCVTHVSFCRGRFRHSCVRHVRRPHGASTPPRRHTGTHVEPRRLAPGIGTQRVHLRKPKMSAPSRRSASRLLLSAKWMSRSTRVTLYEALFLQRSSGIARGFRARIRHVFWGHLEGVRPQLRCPLEVNLARSLTARAASACVRVCVCVCL